MNLLFFLYKAKARTTGEAPIYARISVRGKKRAQFSTEMWVKKESWLAKGNGCVLGKSRLAKSYNERLDNIRADINSIYADLERRKQVITPQVIKAIYMGDKDYSLSLAKVIDMYIERQQRDPDIESGTIDTYFARKNNIIKYLKHIDDENLQCIEVNPKLLAGMEDYFKKTLGHGQPHTNRLLKFVRKIMDYAVQIEACDFNSLHSYEYKKVKKKKKIFLNASELQRLVDHRFASARLERIAKLFALQCYTGFSYAELMRFDRSWISKGIDGREWIFGDRQKEESSQYAIPLFSSTKRILESFNYQVPKISNENYNAYLKEVAFIVGIEKHLTTHVGRKTFGNLLRDFNVSLESLAGMYGHASVKTTENHYVDVSYSAIARDMAGIDF